MPQNLTDILRGPHPKVVGETIKRYRGLHKLTKVSLAEALGVARSTINLWEDGKQFPSVSNLWALARLFGTTMDDLALGRFNPNAVMGTRADDIMG